MQVIVEVAKSRFEVVLFVTSLDLLVQGFHLAPVHSNPCSTPLPHCGGYFNNVLT